MPNKIRIYNPLKTTVAPNPAKTIQRKEARLGDIAKPKAQRMMNQSARMTQKDQTLILPKPAKIKGF